MLSNDRAGKNYWEQSWEVHEITKFVDPRNSGLNNYTERCFHNYFCKVFSTTETQGLRLLEIGCARSIWLPYFAKQFGFKVYGIDYSELGCKQAKDILSSVNVEGEVICENFFTPPERLLNYFDVVVSFGVVEHFIDTTACIAAFAKFLKPGGMMINNIPNLIGVNGTLQKLINKPVFDIHVPLSLNDLKECHTRAGLEVLECNHFLSVSLGIVNLNGLNPQKLSTRLKDVFYRNLCRISKLVWAIEEHLFVFPETQLVSPYIMCTAKKK